MAEFLTLNPNLATESNDYAKCKDFLGELGMLGLFPRSTEPHLSVHTHHNHPTHWIVALVWSGYPKLDQNGFRVFCISKQQTPEEDVKEFEHYLVETYCRYDRNLGLLQLPQDWRKQN